jgi:hypothetical protein
MRLGVPSRLGDLVAKKKVTKALRLQRPKVSNFKKIPSQEANALCSLKGEGD